MLVFVVSVTVRAHVFQFKLIANKTDEHTSIDTNNSTNGCSNWNNVPQDMCTFLLGRKHEKQWIRRSESTSAKREWIWIYEYTAFECVLRLNTPQTNRNFVSLGVL